MPKQTTRFITFVERPNGVHAALCPDCPHRHVVEAGNRSKLGAQLESHRARLHADLYERVVLRAGKF